MAVRSDDFAADRHGGEEAVFAHGPPLSKGADGGVDSLALGAYRESLMSIELVEYMQRTSTGRQS